MPLIPDAQQTATFRPSVNGASFQVAVILSERGPRRT